MAKVGTDITLAFHEARRRWGRCAFAEHRYGAYTVGYEQRDERLRLQRIYWSALTDFEECFETIDAGAEPLILSK